MAKSNVLIVEDSAPDAMLLKLALDEAGFDYSLTALRDGAKAIEYIREQGRIHESALPDIILLDMNVPKASGLEILQEIRANNRFAKIPVMVLSSSQAPRDHSAIAGQTNARFEIKPTDLNGYLELGRTIKNSLTNGPQLFSHAK